VVPPFAEEMNRSRRMVSLQARELAENGIRVVVFDFFGTGDSDGDFGSARWDGWLEDLAAVIQWSRAGGARRVSLIAIRLGALLAVRAGAAADLADVVLWQPCTSGKAYLRQFLRLRLAESIVSGKEQSESVSSLLERFAQGESLEVVGYELGAELALAIQACSLEGMEGPAAVKVRWFDLAAAESDPLAPATKAVVDRWARAGTNVTAEPVRGDPFWSLQEITVAPRLIEATTRALIAD
jgi:exosortase A-associated hydrolase 2